MTRSTSTLSLLALPLALLAGCPFGTGSFDGGIFPDGGPPGGAVFTAADIGTECTYNLDAPSNPTNTCKQGLSCLIYTSDGAYIPFPRGGAQNFTKGVWEDHFTRYRQSQPVDEGYCTLIGTWDALPNCPAGTSVKLLATNLAVCLKQCQTAADCGRPGYTCDARFLEFHNEPGGHCVRSCTLDVPDCVRSGHIAFRDQNGQPGAPGFFVAVDDLAGASVCDVGTGMCAANPGTGAQGPGQPCATTRDCIGGTACIQGAVLRSLNDTLPASTPGFCAQPCKPDPAQPLSGGCNQGYACQAGFTFGHGNPFDQNQANGFNVVSIQDNFTPLQAGGFCFPDCEVNGDCNAYPGTECGAADNAMFGYNWNNRSMCMIDALTRD